MKIRNVLSLFDGISCGQVALRRAGIEYDKYYASEIEKQPIWVTQYNFPDTIQLGDVEKWREWGIDWSKIDLLIGGSPCTNLSIAGNREGLEGEQSRLFYSYVDILNHIKKFNPNIKFLLENVESMSDENKGIINNYMGCKPIMINSALLSAQNRKRYYWVNWHLKKESLFGLPTCTIPQPQDKGVVLKDILESSVEEVKEPNLAHDLREYDSKGKILLDDEKASTLTATMGESSCVANEVSQKYYSGRIVGRPLDENGKRKNNANLELTQVVEISSDPNKANNLSTVQKDNVIVEKIDASCLRYERTEEGKKLRKQYESGEIKHGYNEHRILSPRTDGKTNTLTTVEKDNMICEPICVNSQSGRSDGKGKQPFVEDRIYSVEGKAVALNTNWHQNVAEPIPCAMRKRENEKVPEFNGTNKANSLTTVQTDSMVCEPLNNFVKEKYDKFAKDNGYIPKMFNPYNQTEIKEKSPALTTKCGSTTTSSSVLIFDELNKSDITLSYFRSFGSKGKILSEKDDKSPTLTAASGCGGGNVPAVARQVKIGDNYYDFYEGDRKEKTDLDYVGGIVSGRDKWIKDDKNSSRNFSQGNRIYSVRGKSVCLNANGGGVGGKTGLYQINLPDGDYIIRKLTPIECERLQTLCDNYTKLGFDGTKEVKISNSARYKALGNGWTVDVIVHILKFLKGDQNESIKSSISV